jgi:hypothetical protein
MQANVYTRERKHIGSIWSRVTFLTLSLAAAQSLERRALGDSQSLRRLTVVIRNKQCKQINKHYTIQYLMARQTIIKYSTHRYKHVGARIT